MNDVNTWWFCEWLDHFPTVWHTKRKNNYFQVERHNNARIALNMINLESAHEFIAFWTNYVINKFKKQLCTSMDSGLIP